MSKCAKSHNWIKVYDADYKTVGESSYDIPDFIDKMYTCDKCGKWKTE